MDDGTCESHPLVLSSDVLFPGKMQFVYHDSTLSFFYKKKVNSPSNKGKLTS